MSRALRPRAVVFDLDGTLIDSMPLVLAAITHAIAPFGSRPANDIFARLGGPPERFMATLVDDPQQVPVAIERMESFYRENYHLIRPYGDVALMLETLAAAEVATAIWTGRDRVSTVALLGEHRLERYFPTVVCGDDLSSHKPDPAGLREIMGRLRLKPEEIIFVGDADVDVLGGAACGVDTLLIRHSRGIGTGILDRAWRNVESPAEAYRLVLECLAPVE